MSICLQKLSVALAVLGLGFMAAVDAADEISLARFLKDPGFEAPPPRNPQLNAVAGSQVNGWTATPAPANAWTSVSQVEAGGKTVGDQRAAIAPEPKAEATCGCSRIIPAPGWGSRPWSSR